MQKYLFSEAFNKIQVIGFDLDGTLYDEFDFIEQVYKEIASQYLTTEGDTIYKDMVTKWMEKGSSYPFIFSEIANKYSLSKDFEEKSVEVYRSFIPILRMNRKVKFVMDLLKERQIKMFLLTDGKSKLQKNKIYALGIEHYFDYIVITENCPKPSSRWAEDIVKLFNVDSKSILYVGDRACDQGFAVNSGFEFCHINNFV